MSHQLCQVYKVRKNVVQEMGTESGMTTFSSTEHAVYDRQVRVWGLHVQQRLQKSRILIIGNNCLTAEVAKNAVLAGIGTIRILSGTSFLTGNTTGNYLANAGQETTSEAFVKTLRDLNPHVSVELVRRDDLNKHVLKEVDFVVLLTGSLMEQLHINQLCRSVKVKFCCGKSVGPFGWLFLDLLQHFYTPNDKKTEESLEFNSLEEAFGVSCQSLGRKIHGLYFVLRVCSDFARIKGRDPTLEDCPELLKLSTPFFEWEDPDSRRSLDQRILSLFLEQDSEFPPICSIMGGIITNEIVRTVSQNGAPIQNFFFYDVFDSKGILHLIK